MNVNDLKEQRAKLIEGAKLIIDSAEGRDLTDEEQAQFDSMMGQAEDMQSQVDTAERKARLQTAEQGLKVSKRQVQPAGQSLYTSKEDRQQIGDVVRQWALWGSKHSRATPETIRAAERMGINLSGSRLTLDLRTQTKGTTTAGGYTVPQDFGDKIVEHLKYFAPVRDYCTVIQTENGQALPFPNNDDTGNVGAIISEAGETTETDTTFGQATLGAYAYRTLIRLSQELLQDSKFDLEAYLSKKLGERIGRAQEVDFMTGNGSSKPTGLVYSATNAVSSWTTTYANLVSLYYSVDPAYRKNAIWMMHDQTAAAIRSLTDDVGRPLIELAKPFGESAEVESLFGRPVLISNSMDYTGSSKKVIAFGDPSDFMVRDVGECELYTTRDRYIEFGLVGIFAWLRSDSKWFGSTRALKCGTTA